MIGQLRGTISCIANESIILDVGGVGYEVVLSAASIEACEVGEELRLTIFTDVRENAIVLYGFTSRPEREIFVLLKKVKGIGSKNAMSIISHVPSEELLRAIGAEEQGALERVPGIGKKTAQRIIVELRENVISLLGSESSSQPSVSRSRAPISVTSDNQTSDVMLALEKLGVSGDRAKRALEVALEHPGQDMSSGALLRVALQNL